MLYKNTKKCPNCGGKLKHYDYVNRKVKEEYGKSHYIHIERLICNNCGSVHRVLNPNILPFKQYRSDIIYGFAYGDYNNSSLKYEDYPSESTIKRWKNEYHRL